MKTKNTQSMVKIDNRSFHLSGQKHTVRCIWMYKQHSNNICLIRISVLFMLEGKFLHFDSFSQGRKMAV